MVEEVVGIGGGMARAWPRRGGDGGESGHGGGGGDDDGGGCGFKEFRGVASQFFKRNDFRYFFNLLVQIDGLVPAYGSG